MKVKELLPMAEILMEQEGNETMDELKDRLVAVRQKEKVLQEEKADLAAFLEQEI